jgi:MFS family permease
MAGLAERVVAAAETREERDSRGLIWRLGLGAFGLAWAVTTVASYLPPVLERFTSSRTLIGGLLGAEGVFALTVPLVVGHLSDRTETRWGHRRPFMLAALLPMAVALAALPLMNELWSTVAVLGAFFFAYYVYEPPYRSLYPDRLRHEVLGRAQGVQHVLRGGAIGGALVAGGFLLDIRDWAPFLLGAVITAATCGAVILLVHERAGPVEEAADELRGPWRILRREPHVRRFLIANTAWEFTFAAARTFVVLYVVKGLDQPLYVSSVILGTVAVAYLLAASVAGRLGDHFGLARVISIASVIYGVGLCLGAIPQSWRWSYLVAVFAVALCAGTVMTLAWGLLYKLMPRRERGVITGLATMTKGLGLVLGPAAVGGAIDLAGPLFDATNGYAAMWPTVGLPILAVIPLVVSLIRVEEHRTAA